jgi:hypothetical protein
VALSYKRITNPLSKAIVTKKKKWDNPLGLQSPQGLGGTASFVVCHVSFAYFLFHKLKLI